MEDRLRELLDRLLWEVNSCNLETGGYFDHLVVLNEELEALGLPVVEPYEE